MHRVVRKTFVQAVSLGLLLVVACDGRRAQVEPQQSTPALVPSAPNMEILEPYPHGRWRLEPTVSLTRTVLWVSHLLVRHAGSDRQVPGTVAEWRLDPPPAGRSRADALILAQQLASEARREPGRFADLARQHSEDVTTREQGGSLGGVRASDFLLEPEVLDALAALRPGEVSRVVETEHGFQIFQRREPAAEDTVSGMHVVIGHDDTRWLTIVGSPGPTRSRAEARELALRIYEEARLNSEHFSELVSRYSEHPDRAYGGDMGTWSTRTPTHYPRGVEALRELTIGGIAAPVESHYGFEIVQRTPNSPRAEYASQAIRLRFEPGLETSKAVALERARELLEVLRADPTRFEDLLQQYCCKKIERWIDGQAEEPGLDGVVSTLKVGEVASRVVEQYSTIVIPRRVELQAAPAQLEVSFTLPAPRHPDLSWLLASTPIPLLRHQLIQITAEQSAALGLGPEQLQALEKLSRDFTPGLGSKHEAHEFLEQARVLLGSEKSGPYEMALTRSLEARRLRVADRKLLEPTERVADRQL